MSAYQFGFEEIHITERNTNDCPLSLPAAADVELGQVQIIRLRGPRNLAITSAAADIIDPTETAYSLSASNTITVRADAGDIKIKRIDRTGTAYYELDAPLANLGDLADTVNSVAVVNGAVTIDSDDIVAPHTGVNYTAANTDTITTHLAGIDTALASAGGGATAPQVRALTPAADTPITQYTGIEEIYLITPSTDVNITLPSTGTVGSGYKYQIKNLSTHTITLKGATGDNIDGVLPADGVPISTQYESLTVVTDGSDWFII